MQETLFTPQHKRSNYLVGNATNTAKKEKATNTQMLVHKSFHKKRNMVIKASSPFLLPAKPPKTYSSMLAYKA
ncbi:hypothetical protein SLEP1_g2783 [Rubroshorea leprosula]|uniref:Uncharacterized protein n=1 Tax=Rubroshorea leprosula TaxID=152421 RepID=A0AAV5HP37_9ROSI|nr:hypothetical protein SLEP1_g2783 [Rubroshorea leprosula]